MARNFDNINENWTYSYSGADCRAYANLSNQVDVFKLDALATISISIHEAKSPVRRLGHKSISGFTESLRTIAGSVVFTVVKDHPLKNLLAADGKNNYVSLDEDKGAGSFRGNKISTLLNPIDIYLIYKTEVDKVNRADLKIKGIRFINEGIVSSVNDMVTEIVMQFVAEDVEEFTLRKESSSSEIQTQTSEESVISKPIITEEDSLRTSSEEVGEVSISKASELANYSKKQSDLLSSEPGIEFISYPEEE